MVSATFLTDLLDVTGVWTSCIALAGGACAAAALMWGWPRPDPGRAAALGMGIGFLAGIPFSAVAPVLLSDVP